MAGNPKFSILEKDGEEYSYPVEYVPEAVDVLYKKGETKTVKEAIDIAFMAKRVFSEDLIIPTDHVMIISNLETHKDVLCEGDLVIL